jgi:hypothetical protein
MATQAQITANQLNALKSKGPVSPEGKQAVRFNALKTGIDATQIIITGESPEEFEAFAAALRDTWRPADLAESAFVDRLRIAEAQIWDRALSSGATDFGEAFERTEKLLGRLQAARVKAAARLPKPPAPITEQSQFPSEEHLDIDDSPFDF